MPTEDAWDTCRKPICWLITKQTQKRVCLIIGRLEWQALNSHMNGCAPGGYQRDGVAAGDAAASVALAPPLPCRLFYKRECKGGCGMLHVELAIYAQFNPGSLKAKHLAEIFTCWRPIAAVVTYEGVGVVLFKTQQDFDGAMAMTKMRFASFKRTDSPIVEKSRDAGAPPCHKFYASGRCDDRQCRLLHTELAVRVSMMPQHYSAEHVHDIFRHWKPFATLVTDKGIGMALFRTEEDHKAAIASDNCSVSKEQTASSSFGFSFIVRCDDAFLALSVPAIMPQVAPMTMMPMRHAFAPLPAPLVPGVPGLSVVPGMSGMPSVPGVPVVQPVMSPPLPSVPQPPEVVISERTIRQMEDDFANQIVAHIKQGTRQMAKLGQMVFSVNENNKFMVQFIRKKYNSLGNFLASRPELKVEGAYVDLREQPPVVAVAPPMRQAPAASPLPVRQPPSAAVGRVPAVKTIDTPAGRVAAGRGYSSVAAPPQPRPAVPASSIESAASRKGASDFGQPPTARPRSPSPARQRGRSSPRRRSRSSERRRSRSPDRRRSSPDRSRGRRVEEDSRLSKRRRSRSRTPPPLPTPPRVAETPQQQARRLQEQNKRSCRAFLLQWGSGKWRRTFRTVEMWQVLK